MSVRKRPPNDKKSDEKSRKDGKKKSPFDGKSFKPTRLPEKTADNSWLPHQTWARLVMLGCVFAVAIFSSYSQNPNKRSTMAKHSDILHEKRHHSLLCSPSYKKEIMDLGNDKCLPAKCGRMVLDGVVTEKEAHGLLAIAKKGLSKGGSSGGASILDLHSGALSKGEHFVNLYQLYPDLFDQNDLELYRSVKMKVKNALAGHFQVDPNSLYLTHPTFFSRITSEPAKTLHDEYWHVHVDKETYPNFHFTSLLYLTDFNKDFKGGTFVFVDGHDKINRTIEPKLGRMSAFTSGIENKHHVDPVTDGTRYALTMGFSCDVNNEIADPFSNSREKQ